MDRIHLVRKYILPHMHTNRQTNRCHYNSLHPIMGSEGNNEKENLDSIYCKKIYNKSQTSKVYIYMIVAKHEAVIKGTGFWNRMVNE